MPLLAVLVCFSCITLSASCLTKFIALIALHHRCTVRCCHNNKAHHDTIITRSNNLQHDICEASQCDAYDQTLGKVVLSSTKTSNHHRTLDPVSSIVQGHHIHDAKLGVMSSSEVRKGNSVSGVFQCKRFIEHDRTTCHARPCSVQYTRI